MKRRWISLRANAKLNLCLEVIGPRDNGYHELATVFQAISIYDTVRLELDSARRGLQIVSEGWPVPRGPGNLCWKAAVHFFGALAAEDLACGDGLLRGLRIRVVKRVPPGGGLGGGSSDAAAVLVGLNHLLGHPLASETLLAAAADIGSDVAFFASGAPAALARGRGEQLELLRPAQDFWTVVAWPGAPVSTAWAYGQLSAADFSPGTAAEVLAGAMRTDELAARTDAFKNTFAKPVAKVREDICHLLELLRAAGAGPVSLAGSGACVWGRFDERSVAESVASELRRKGLWAVVAWPARRGVEIADVSE